jgi:hypothetical protein
MSVPDYYVERNAIRVFIEVPEGASSRELSLAGKEVKMKADDLEDALRDSYDDLFRDSTGSYNPPKFKRTPYRIDGSDSRNGRGYVGILLVGGPWLQEVVNHSVKKNRRVWASQDVGVNREMVAKELLKLAKDLVGSDFKFRVGDFEVGAFKVRSGGRQYRWEVMTKDGVKSLKVGYSDGRREGLSNARAARKELVQNLNKDLSGASSEEIDEIKGRYGVK